MRRPIYSSALFVCFFVGTLAFGKTTYKVDPTHSSVDFSIRHMFSKVKGNFQKFDGTIDFDVKKKKLEKISFSIDSATINTNNKKRDDHLRGKDFFNVQKFKKVTFTSKKVKKKGKNRYTVTGDLNMHGITKPVTYQVQFLGSGKDPWGNNKVGFSATTTINRKDFGIVYNKKWVPERLLIGDKVEVEVHLELNT